MDDLDDDELLARALAVLQRRAAQRSAPSPTVSELFTKYTAASKVRKSWSSFVVRLTPFVDAHADRPAESISVMDWTLHAQQRRETKLPGKHGEAGLCYSPQTVNCELGAVKALLNWSTANGLLRFNPLAAARRTKAKKRRETAPREWEIGQALAACETQEQTVMVLCAADAGMRRGEIIQLRHDWIDTERKTISLPNWACKNSRGGTIPATQRLLDAIAALPRHIRYPHVLVSERGRGPYSRAALDSWWVAIRERAGLEAAPGDSEVHLHDCRAAAATNALARGVRLQTVSKRILRHANLATTQLYLRGDAADPDEARAAVEAMEAGILRDQRRGPRSAPTTGDALAMKSPTGSQVR